MYVCMCVNKFIKYIYIYIDYVITILHQRNGKFFKR